MRKMAAAACAAMLAGTALGASPAKRPDFTGVWTNAGTAALGGVTNVAPQALPMRPEVKARVDAYNKLVGPTGDSPGGSGGLPLRIGEVRGHRDDRLGHLLAEVALCGFLHLY